MSPTRCRSPRNPACGNSSAFPTTYAVAAIVPLGKPVHQVSKLRRKAVDEFVTRERFDGAAF